MPNISLSFTVSAFVVAFLVLLAAAVSVYFYRFTVPPVPPRRKVLLIILRSAALALLLLFLVEPLLRLTSSSVQKPVLAVLIDDSKSMTIKDKTGDRAEDLRRALTNILPGSVGNNGEVRYYSFGSRVVDRSSPDSLRLDQDATDISAALRKVNEEKERLNIGAVLLVTDGSYNLGQNPIYEAEELNLPIFTVGIGDSTEQKDVLITKLVTNDLVYNDTEVPVDVTLKSSGYKDQKVEVTLSDGGRELARRQVTLQEGTREYATRLTYTPLGEGVKKYTVRVSHLENELTGANNQRSFLARILKSKLHVMVLAGAPSADVAVTRQTLAEDNNLSVSCRTAKSTGAFYEGVLTTSLLDSADCLVFIGFPSRTVSDASIEMIRTAVLRRSIPMFFVEGTSIDERRLSAFSSLLPFTESNVSASEQWAFVQPVAEQATHPILAVNTVGGMESLPERLAGWDRLPPIFITQTSYKAKAEATVLATVRINNIVMNEPLIAIRNINKQKTLAILGYGIWRWRLMAQGNPQTARLFSTFLSNGIRWLTTREDTRPVKVTPTKAAFAQGEPVEFVGQVYDASANPVENAQVRLVARQGASEFETTLRPVHNGLYEGSLEGLSTGDYTFNATASLDNQPLGEDRGRFSVGELDLEYQDTRMNVQLLRQLAARTGGEFLLPSQLSNTLSSVTNQASFVPRQVKEARELELWNWKYMLGIVVLLFAVEWLIRKRSGML